MGPVGESAVQAVFGAVAFGVRLVDADSSFVVAQVVPALSVPRGPVQEWTSGTRKGGGGHSVVAPAAEFRWSVHESISGCAGLSGRALVARATWVLLWPLGLAGGKPM